MKLYITRKQWLSRHLMVPAALFFLLAVGRVIITEQFNGHASQSKSNQEPKLEPRSDYEKTSVGSGGLQTEHDVTGKFPSMFPDQKESQEPALSNNDPFALTFEDYLREASLSSAHHIASDTNDDSSFLSSADSVPTTASLLVEDDGYSVKTKESPIIDYIFPPPRQETAQSEKHETKLTNKDTHNIEVNSKELFNEIRLLFSWKQLPTNKCSKTCGKGYRLNHLSCVDLKYDVKVEDVLCIRSNLVKPSETSDEVCNEIDCPPQWSSVGFHECNTVTGDACQRNFYKRAQCTMINKHGTLVYLDDSRCPTTGSSRINETQSDQPTVSESTFRDAVFDDAISADESVDVDERNDILSNLEAGGALESLLSKTSADHGVQYEPFYEPSPWSNCSGAPCGQLGSRTRELYCRLHLSRSSRFAELPESSCQNAPLLETREPCYMDCGPDNRLQNNDMFSVAFNETDTNDETVYDLEMTRFNWKKGGWTKCSVDCLGGQRESIFECIDSESKMVVESSFCGEHSKPHPIIEVCNDIPCTPEWRAGEYSKCTRSCGSAGIKTRNVECVQQVPSQEGPSFLVVSNDQCIQTYGSVPSKSEHCNRVDCKPEWSVGPWSECSKKCGRGIRNRTVICVQEFANKEGPKPGSYHKNIAKLPSPDLLEALSLSGKNWTPGQVTQVPFHECYEEYKSVPPLDEECFTYCENEPYIDADVYQDYRMTQLPTKKKSITLRVGGKAELMEGQNLRIRCKIVNNKSHIDNLVKKQSSYQVEWRKDGIRIFLNGSKVADKQYVPEDNSIFGNDVLSDEKNQFMADQPSSKRSAKPTPQGTNSRRRNLRVRSWNNNQGTQLDRATQENFTFIPQRGGRFSLKENTLRIKRLKLDDAGTYTCSHGSLGESIELKVINRRDSIDTEQKLLNNLGL